VPEPSSSSTTDRVLGGRYRLLTPIARGGMAEVWEGHDEVLGRPVAIKVLHSHLAKDDGFTERFRREAVAAAKLVHPGIVNIFDTGTDGDTAFIVMELVRGRTLRDAIEGDGSLPVAMAVHVAMDVADALDCAHRNGLIHRDVKPANILLTVIPGTTAVRVKVTDFGIAKAVSGGSDLTQTGAVIGTAKYLSPEQVEGRSPDHRSDVYALGVVLYEMLCGRPPYTAETELATALQHVRSDPMPPRRLVAGIPKPLETIVLKAMAKEPDERFGSAVAFKEALAAVDLGDDDAIPFVVRDPTPPGGIAPLPRRARPSWLPLALIGAVVLLALVVTVALLTQSDAPSNTPAAQTSTHPTGSAIHIASVRAFDPPPGDGTEHDTELNNAIDGDPSTSWHSDHYSSRLFGNLKQGVGLALTLDSPTKLNELKVTSSVQGWAASVYVAASPASTLDGWGQPVDTKRGINGATTFSLKGTQGGAVLLWITDLGPDATAEIAEVSVTG
jgi:serine/threonine-protein kinase